MTRVAEIPVATLALAVLVGAAGCTRTSDGSIELKTPSFGRLLSFDDQEEQARIVPSRTLAQPAVEPVPAGKPARSGPRRATIAVPTMSIGEDAPFRRADPARPMTCRNEKTSTGRIRYVCA
jgi:hypothetical protein